MPATWTRALMTTLACVLVGCTADRREPTPIAGRSGDEIVVAGQLFDTGAPVVLWSDPDGYDAYQTTPRFARPDAETKPAKLRYGQRSAPGREGPDQPWTLEALGTVVDQFVLHYDVCGTSRTCFRILHDVRELSVHFMLDLDGTIYQTLDVQERAWHATKANNRSVGIEIANIGAYPRADQRPLTDWYARDAGGRTRITIPDRLGDGGLRDPSAALRPSRDRPVPGVINGSDLVMYDLTDAQYDSLAKLTAALHRALPRIKLVYPADGNGSVDPNTLDVGIYEAFQGVLGHWHVQDNKIDPGPALDWDRVIDGANESLRSTPGREHF